MFASLKTVRDRAGFRCVRIGWKAEGCRGPDAEAVAGAIDSVGVVGGGDEKSTVSFVGRVLYYFLFYHKFLTISIMTLYLLIVFNATLVVKRPVPSETSRISNSIFI